MIGISFYFGFNIEPEERVKLLKNHGIDCVITNPEKKLNKQNGSIKTQVELFNKYKIKLSSLHSRYGKFQKHFWKRGLIGAYITKRLMQDIKTAHKYGFNSVVVHLQGEFSEVGKNRLLKVLSLCEELNIPLAVENLNNQKLVIDTFNNIEHPYLKFCYDSGHNNLFDPKFDYLSKFGDKLVALHLHDNMGKSDDHTLNVFGTIDWEELAKKLAKLPPINLDYELLMNFNDGFTAEQVVDTCVKQAKELQFLIDKHRKENLKNIKVTVGKREVKQ